MTTNILYGGNLQPVASLVGARNSQRVGYYLSAAGDVNADGYDDFMVAGYHHYNVSSEDWNSGGVFLFLGKQNFPDINEQPITNADAIFEGYRKNDMVGYNIAGKGDFNGDGYDDMLIGAPGKWETNLPNNGYLYIVLGRPEADWPKPSKIKDIADFSLVGESYLDQLGYAVDFAGDLNQDGFDEIVVSAAFKDIEGQQWAGKVYLIPGSAEGFQGEIPITEAAIASFIFPMDEGTLGYSVAGVEDVNADGYPDFTIGAEGAGHCFLLFGKEQLDWGQNFNLSAADVIFTPEKRFDRPGWQIRPAGDVNADKIPDFLISGVSLNYSFGKFYLLLGRNSWPDTLSLSHADASYIGEHIGAHAGMSMDAVG
ncbi:FG-GAP repeat protein, partial [bacterium]|nr:FG-GAP repeat protein [bacterium]